MDNPEGVLRPGMFARVDTTLSTRAEALVVPEEALVPQGGKQYVIKVVDRPGTSDNAGKVSQRSEVQIGMRRAGKVEILQGVSAGETIVLAGHQRVQRDGAPLEVVELRRRQSRRKRHGRAGQRHHSGRASRLRRIGPAAWARPIRAWSPTAWWPVARPGPRRTTDLRYRLNPPRHLHAARRSFHPPPGLRDRAFASAPAGGRRVVHPLAGARISPHRRAGRHGQHDAGGRVGRGHRNAGHQAARGLDRRDRRGGHHHLHLAAGAKPDLGALQAQQESGGWRRRRARPCLACAWPAARYGRRAHHLQGGSRRHADDLAGIHQRLAVAAGDQRPRQPHRQAAPANRVRRGRCEDQRRTQVLHAHLAGPGQAGRLPAHHAGCRGCLAQAEPRGSRRAHRRPAARIQRHGADRPEHRAAVCRGVAQAGAGLHRQAQGRGAHRAGGAGGALERAPERGAFGVAGCHPPGHRQSAGGLRRRARDHAAHRGGSARRREGAGCQ